MDTSPATPLRIVLLSPRGPLYRHRGGIWKKTMRYAPLTLTTLASLVPLTPLVIARTVVLNGLLGIIFGWLYWRHGLEAAMISHFSADIVLHVLLAL